MTTQIVKAMVNVKILVNSSHVHASNFNKQTLFKVRWLFWKQKYLHSALPKVHMKGGARLGLNHCRIECSKLRYDPEEGCSVHNS